MLFEVEVVFSGSKFLTVQAVDQWDAKTVAAETMNDSFDIDSLDIQEMLVHEA